MLKTFVKLCVVLNLLGVTRLAAAAPACLAVVGTNDLHGALEPYVLQAPIRSTANSSSDPAAHASVRWGGAVGLSGYLRVLRQHYGERLVLLDGGDLFQGTLASNLFEGRSVIEAYNALGYQGAAIGNHEFDFGAAVTGRLRLPNEPSEPELSSAPIDRLGVLKARMAQAHFPFFTLNIFEQRSGKRVNWPNTTPSILRQIGGIKVGIMGISTVDTPNVTRAINVAGLHFVDPVPLIKAEAATLRQQGAALIILVGHVGGKCYDLHDANDISSCQGSRRDAELLTILRSLPVGTVDVAIGGHTHQFMAHWVGRTATLESGARGQYFGYVEACVQASGSGIDVANSHIYGAQPLCLDVWRDGSCRAKRFAMLPVRAARFLSQEVQPETAVQQVVQPYLDAVAHLEAQPLHMQLPAPLGQTKLTQLVAEALRRTTHADFGLQNRGGIRTTLPAGDLHYGDIFRALPFDNMTVQVTLSGAQIMQLIRLFAQKNGVTAMPAFAGLHYRWQSHTPPGTPASLEITSSKGVALDANQLYTVATSDFMLQGGDGSQEIFNNLAAERLQTTNISMRDAFIQLLRDVLATPHAAALRNF